MGKLKTALQTAHPETDDGGGKYAFGTGQSH